MKNKTLYPDTSRKSLVRKFQKEFLDKPYQRTFSEKVWCGFDEIEGRERFVWFIAFIIIPFAILSSIFNSTTGLFYMFGMALWRWFTVKK